jgi:hypothetical protein
LRERTGAQLDGDVTRAYGRLDLKSVVALDVLKRGARVAQNPKNPYTVPGITPAELEALEKEETLGFGEQTKFLKVSTHFRWISSLEPRHAYLIFAGRNSDYGLRRRDSRMATIFNQYNVVAVGSSVFQ